MTAQNHNIKLMFPFSSSSPEFLGQPFGSQGYRPVLGAEEQHRAYDGTFARVKLKFFPITFMNQYANKSFEELRLADYSIGRKGSVNGTPKKEEDLTIVMANFIPQTYTLVSDVKMTDITKLGSSIMGTNFGSLNNCFGITCSRSETPSNSFGSFFQNPSNTLNNTPSSILPTVAFQNSFTNSPILSNSVSSKPLLSFSNNNSSAISTPTTTFTIPSSSPPFSIVGAPAANCFNKCQESTQIGIPFQIPTYFGPKVYPIFNGPNLVGYTVTEMSLNPSIQVQSDTEAKFAAHELDIIETWNEFYEHCQMHQLRLRPTSKAGEFLLDTESRRSFEVYDKLWNHPLNNYSDQADESEDKIICNKYWEPLNLKQLTTPYTDAQLAEKRRRSLLSTKRIFPSLIKTQFKSTKVQEEQNYSESQSSRKLTRKGNPFRQHPEASCSQPSKFPTTFIVDRMSGGEAAGHNEQCPKINEKESEDIVNSKFTTIGSDAENVKIIDRSRRPRSKSLSVRPRGKSCGVHLTRDRYYCIPSIQTMDSMVDEFGRCIIENFEVGHMDYGHMVFESKIDVAGINLDEIVVFNLKEMFLYPATDQDCDLPLSLQKLNQPALVTLVQVWPQRYGTNEFIRDLDIINSIDYELLLRNTCERMGVNFISYDPVKGHWKFRIQDRMVHIEESCDT